jgi:hypothetical protein
MTDEPVEKKRLVVPPSLYDSEAYNALRPVARVLFDKMVKMARALKGDGWIGLSERQAKDLLNVARETVSKAFIQLQAYGFIVRLEKGRYRGKKNEGVASQWRLTSFSYKGAPATREYESRVVMRKVWKDADDRRLSRRLSKLKGVKFITPELEVEIRPRKPEFELGTVLA